jgi:multiple sugar transport system substrate-binding protein
MKWRRRGGLRPRAGRAGRLLVVLVPLSAALIGCAPRSRPTEVLFWQFWPAGVITPLLQKFEAENPGLKVRTKELAWETGRDTILAAVASGTVPDLCEIGSASMPRFLASRGLADWSAGVADLRGTLRGWEMCSIGDALYGVPWVLGTRALFYDKTLFARAGLDSTKPPGTWADLYRDAAAIQKHARGAHGFGIHANDPPARFEEFMPFAWGNGGEILSAGLDSSRFDSPENRAALAFYLSLRKVGTLGSGDALDGDFTGGRLGLEISGAWLFARISKEAPTLRYGVAPVPKPAEDRGTHASFAGGEVLVGFEASKHKEAALRLARFLVRPDNALALAEAMGNVVPATMGADTSGFYRARPGPQMMIRQLALARFAPNHPEWEAMEAAIEDAIGKALDDSRSPPDTSAARATAEADQKIAELLRKH